jgi:TRAP-type C4-dicarboxylate transport system permease small subunit
MRLFKQCLDRLDDACKGLIVILFITIIVVAFLQVFSRFIMGKAIPWTDELSRFGLVWITFIAAGLGVKRGSHVAIDILYNVFPPPIKKAVGILINVSIIAFGIFVIYYGSTLVQTSLTQLSASLSIPIGGVYAVVPISGFLMAVFALGNLVSFFAKEESGIASESE